MQLWISNQISCVLGFQDLMMSNKNIRSNFRPLLLPLAKACVVWCGYVSVTLRYSPLTYWVPTVAQLDSPVSSIGLLCFSSIIRDHWPPSVDGRPVLLLLSTWFMALRTLPTPAPINTWSGSKQIGPVHKTFSSGVQTWPNLGLF